jgi:hypothetical protein
MRNSTPNPRTSHHHRRPSPRSWIGRLSCSSA